MNCGLEVVDHPPVARRRRVVELVDHDVVELLGIELAEAGSDGLDAREEDLGVGLLLVCVEETEISVGLHTPEHVPALAQDLLTMRDEENPPDTADASCRTRRATSCRGQWPAPRDQRRVPQSESVSRAIECFALDLPRRDRFGNGLRRQRRRRRSLSTPPATSLARAFLVVRQPGSRQADGARVVPESSRSDRRAAARCGGQRSTRLHCRCPTRSGCSSRRTRRRRCRPRTRTSRPSDGSWWPGRGRHVVSIAPG